jgi:hypothetical protein
LTGLVQITSSTTAPLLLELEELVEPVVELDELLLEDEVPLTPLLDEELELDELELLSPLLDEELELLLDEELLLEDELVPPPALNTVIRALFKTVPELINEVSTRKGKTGVTLLVENKKPFL